MFRAFYRLEVKGLENFAKAGQNAIIALNHVSFLDAALALSMLTSVRCSPSTWHGQALVGEAVPEDHARHAARSVKPMAIRTLINAVKAGETLVIFPRGGSRSPAA